MKILQLSGTTCIDSLRTRRAPVSFGVCLALAGLAVVLAAPRSVRAQAVDPNKIPAPRDVTFTTKDRINLAGTYLGSNLGREAPVIVFLHREGGNRLVWTKGIAPALQQEGYAVITVDLRGHGQSKVDAGANDGRRRRNDKLVPLDYKHMVEFDLEPVKSFMYEDHQAERLNMNKTGLVGAEMGAAVAVWYAMLDWQKPPHPDGIGPNRTPRGQDIRAIALLTPENVPGLPYPQPLIVLRNPEWDIHLLVAVGDQDKKGLREAERIYELFTKLGKNPDRSYMQIYPGELKGADLLTPKELNVSAHLSKFFEKSLKSLPANWRDRKSKIAAD